MTKIDKDSRKKKVLITGGCGFIGSNFIRYLLNKDFSEAIEVINIDCLTYAGNTKNLEDYSSNKDYSFFNIDIRNQKEMKHIFKKYKPQIVVNFAAESHVDRSILSPNIFLETNVLGTSNLLNLSLDFKVKKFIQISTDEVYGDLDETQNPFTEKSIIKPSSPYASSKAAADLLVLSFQRTYGLPVIITRCSNNYGPYQHIEKLIPKVINNAIKGIKIPIYGKGDNIRDWIHVQDHCRGIWRAICDGTSGNVYNFGGNCEIRNLTIVKKILEILNMGDELVEFVSDRLGHDYRYAIDSSKSFKELGWKPLIDFEKGIKDTINWYYANKEWIASLKE